MGELAYAYISLQCGMIWRLKLRDRRVEDSDAKQERTIRSEVKVSTNKPLPDQCIPSYAGGIHGFDGLVLE